MKPAEAAAIGTVIRWILELGMIWGLVFPETGLWTSITITCMTVGIEANYLNAERVRGALIMLAEQMSNLYDPTRKS